MSTSKMSIDSLLNPNRGHCTHSSCDRPCYHASRTCVFHSKNKSFGSKAPPNNRSEYADGLRVTGKCLLWPIVRTDKTKVRAHRTNGLCRKEPCRCPVNSCRLNFHDSRRLSSHFQKEHLSSSIDVDRKSYVCPVTTCSRQFSSSGWLSRHFNKFHALPPRKYSMYFHIRPGPTF
jgi:hypothetical protein